jgi:hypothetical protein
VTLGFIPLFHPLALIVVRWVTEIGLEYVGDEVVGSDPLVVYLMVVPVQGEQERVTETEPSYMSGIGLNEGAGDSQANPLSQIRRGP